MPQVQKKPTVILGEAKDLNPRVLPKSNDESPSKILHSRATILPMNIRDFRRIALSFPDAEESSHMGQPDFRVGGHIFATLASAKQGYGNLKLTLEQQQAFVEELPEIFLPIPGGWGRMGMTHIRLAAASEDILTGALQAAYNLRLQKHANSCTELKSPKPTKSSRAIRRKK
jgi:YjbR protein